MKVEYPHNINKFYLGNKSFCVFSNFEKSFVKMNPKGISIFKGYDANQP